MAPVRTFRFCAVLSFMLAAAGLIATDLRADPAAGRHGWTIERGTDRPSYAAVEPVATNLNIDMVVLACEETPNNRVLQLQVYLTDEGPLRPKSPTHQSFKISPRAAVSIDRQTFPVALLFADDYAVLADAQEGAFPLLSDALLEAMQRGSRMTLRFDLLEEGPSRAPAFDGEAIVDLEAPQGREAVATMRRCTGPATDLQARISMVRR